ncbi:MAG TPA: hypothetical protein P5548_01140 [Candidatus Moranbacteria bacterium]|nr:hypothetical protein [Candidatus Moranbacteria bacterium]
MLAVLLFNAISGCAVQNRYVTDSYGVRQQAVLTIDPSVVGAVAALLFLGAVNDVFFHHSYSYPYTHHQGRYYRHYRY